MATIRTDLKRIENKKKTKKYSIRGGLVGWLSMRIFFYLDVECLSRSFLLFLFFFASPPFLSPVLSFFRVCLSACTYSRFIYCAAMVMECFLFSNLLYSFLFTARCVVGCIGDGGFVIVVFFGVGALETHSYRETGDVNLQLVS